MKNLYGTKRPEMDRIKIFALSISGIEYDTQGFLTDLYYYYQGRDSVYKAERLGARMDDPQKAELLIEFVQHSNYRMEQTGLTSG